MFLNNGAWYGALKHICCLSSPNGWWFYGFLIHFWSPSSFLELSVWMHYVHSAETTATAIPFLRQTAPIVFKCKKRQGHWRIFLWLSWSSLTFCLRKREPISLTLPIPFPKRNKLPVFMMVSHANLPGELLGLKESRRHTILQQRSLYFAANVAIELYCISN